VTVLRGRCCRFTALRVFALRSAARRCASLRVELYGSQRVCVVLSDGGTRRAMAVPVSLAGSQVPLRHGSLARDTGVGIWAALGCDLSGHVPRAEVFVGQ
jgi:hypothetical protein